MSPHPGCYGILDGTTAVGGGEGCMDGRGTRSLLETLTSCHDQRSGGWKDTVIHSFTSDTYGVGPGSVIFDSAGNLYGVTYSGGAYGKGRVFQLVPVPGGWQYRVLHDFTGGADGAKPIGSVMFDRAWAIFTGQLTRVARMAAEQFSNWRPQAAAGPRIPCTPSEDRKTAGILLTWLSIRQAIFMAPPLAAVVSRAIAATE